MKHGLQIAILLRHPHRLLDAHRCGQALMQYGATVSFYCLCRETDPKMDWNIQPLLATCASCFTDSSDLAVRYNLACLSFSSLVRKIESCDWIIPI